MISEDQLQSLRHSSAHMLAAAVLELYPGTKLGIGPAIEHGFYYDFLFPTGVTISDADLPAIEKKMKHIMKGNHAFVGKEVGVAEAEAFEAAQPFKRELIAEFATGGQTLTLFTSGPFTDLCRGGHAENTNKIPADGLKLEKVAGAYWRGDEKNQMLTRIYGLLFATRAELDAYLAQQAEAKKRDHRKLGKELKLFTISELIGPGLPLMQPNGMIVRKAVEDYLWQLHHDKEYMRVWTPHIAKEDLYVTSGHAAKFGDELFRVQGKEDKFIMKPMNCPHHMQIFVDNQFSYRDLPVRYFEPATVYRDEKSGQLGGLTRVRAITQDDGHLFCRVSQIEQEVSTIVGIIKQFYTTFGMMDGYWVSLSVRAEDKSKYLGTDEAWQAAEGALEQAAKANGLNYKRVEGEAAFYGPKLDFIFKDAIGRPWQLATIQCDFNLPERFNLSYTNEKGEKERPVVVHRAISGSLERFMGVMIEHFAGAFPVWLSPVQVCLATVSDAFVPGARAVLGELKQLGIRAMLDDAQETIGKKVRTAAGQKIPYIVVMGEREVSGEDWTIRVRGQEAQLKFSKAEFIAKVEAEIAGRTL